MAAMRRRSGVGVVIALVFFVVLTFGGAGASIYLYQQLELAKDAIVQTEKGLKTIASDFEKYGWGELPQQDPTALNVTFTRESFDTMRVRLATADHYLREIQPLVGYESTEAMERAIRNAPFQEIVLRGGFEEEDQKEQFTYKSLKALLEQYEKDYVQLTSRRDQLQRDKTALEQQIRARLKELEDKEARHQAERNKLIGEHRKAIDTLNAGKRQLESAVARERQGKLAVEKNVQAKENERRALEQQMRRQVKQLEKEIERLTPKPEREEEKLTPDGAVVTVKPGFITIEGGENIGVEVDFRFVVYTKTPAGTNDLKAIVRVGKVYDAISEVFILTAVEEDEEGLGGLQKGDLVVSEDKWTRFYKEPEGGQ